MASRIQFRRDTAANWEKNNPLLMQGEIGLILDSPNLYKMGDGSTEWNNLPISGFNGNILEELGNDANAVISQDLSMREFGRVFSVLADRQKAFYSPTNANLISNDPDTRTEGRYIDTSDGRWVGSRDYYLTRFIAIEAGKVYTIYNAISINWFDKDYNWLSGNNVVSPGTVTAPSSAAFLRLNYTTTANIGVYQSDSLPSTAPIRQYSEDSVLSSTARKPFPYDNNDQWPMSPQIVEWGYDKFLLDAILDVDYELGYSYSLASVSKTAKTATLYKEDITVIPSTSSSVTVADTFTKVIAEFGSYTLLGSGRNTKSMILVNFNALRDDALTSNLFFYLGLGISPTVFHNGIIWSLYNDIQNSIKEVNDSITELTTQVEDIDGEVSKIITKDGKLINQEEVDKINEIVSELTEVEENIQNGGTLFGSDSAGFLNNTGPYSGWGQSLGTPQNFDCVGIRIRAQSSGTAPITKVRVRIKSKDKNGTIYADATKTGLNIQPGQDQQVIVYLGTVISNSQKELLYIEWLCDALCARFGYSGYPYIYMPADGTSYPTFTYATNGNINQETLENVSGDGTNYYSNNIWYGMYESQVQLTDAQVENIGQRLDIPTPTSEAIKISLPNELSAIVGDTLQLFFRGIVAAVNPYVYDLFVTCDKGAKYPRYFQVTPTASDIGDYDWTLTIRDNNKNVLSTAKTTLKIRDAVKSPASEINIACFGDSLTYNGVWCREAHRRLTETGGTPAGKGLTNINFVGKKKNGTTGYFGEGGWNWSDYTSARRPAFRFQVSGVTSISIGAVYTNNNFEYTVIEVNVTSGTGNILLGTSDASNVPTASGTLTKKSGNGDATITYSSAELDSANPLWNSETNEMDFIPYANEYCDGRIDCVYTLLTWNGLVSWKDDWTSFINQVKIFADTLHRDFPDAKMTILGIQIPSINGGIAANFGSIGNGITDQYGTVNTVFNMNKAYQDFANQEEYKNWVEFVNVSSQVDSEFNMPYSEEPVNTRNSEVTEKIGTNGVHPSDSGYLQIGDVVYRNFIKEFCQ
jgi:hypothetical protein|nr:MAG TPA: hyaluronidase [Bacteriophage sp.]